MGAIVVAVHWPDLILQPVRGFRAACQWCTQHTLLGMPLDWPIRFVFIGVLYYLLRCRRWSHRTACALTLAVLLGKELFDIVAHQNPLSPRAPDWGDAADVLSGLAGLGVGIYLYRVRAQRRMSERCGLNPP